jgi:regulator of nonsense transcripts 2
MTGDPQYANMSLMSAFLKGFSRAYLGPQPAKDDGAVEDQLPDGVQELIPTEVQKQMRQLFVSYFETASKTLVKGQMVGCEPYDKS